MGPLLKSYSVLILTQAEIKGNSVLRDTRANAPISHGITPQYHSYQCRLWTSLTVGWFLLSCFNLVSDEVKNLQSLSTPFAYAWHIPSLVYCYRFFDETCRDSQEIAFQARFGSWLNPDNHMKGTWASISVCRNYRSKDLLIIILLLASKSFQQENQRASVGSMHHAICVARYEWSMK